MHSKLNELRDEGFFIHIHCFALSHIEYINKTHYPDNPEYFAETPFTVEAIIRNERGGTNFETDGLGRSVFESIAPTLEEAVDLVYSQIQEAKLKPTNN